MVTTKNFNLKLGTRDYVGDITRHANFYADRFSGSFSPNTRNITLLWFFYLDCLVFFSRSNAQPEPWHRFSRLIAQTTWFRPRRVLFVVWTMCDVICGRYAPKTPRNWGWIGNFKPKWQNFQIAISLNLLGRPTSYFRTYFRPTPALRGLFAIVILQIQDGWQPPSWKKDMT